jgi:hypothetical protein
MGANKIPKDKVPVKLDKFIRMEANLVSREEKLRVLFGLDVKTATDRELNNADVMMCRWRKHPMYDAIWKDELAKQDYEDYSLARQVLRKGMKQDQDKWLAMNSAVNVISNGNKRIYQDDNSTVHVRIEGLPDIGSPDDDG